MIDPLVDIAIVSIHFALATGGRANWIIQLILERFHFAIGIGEIWFLLCVNCE